MYKRGENKGVILAILVWVDFILCLHGSRKVEEK